MVEYLRTAERYTVPRNRIIELVVVMAGFVGTAVLAAPATAATSPSLTVGSSQHLNADGTVRITGTYTCTGDQIKVLRNSGLKQGEVKGATTTRTGLLPCDGTAHDYTIDISSDAADPFQPGPAQLRTTWVFYNAAGYHEEVQLADVPVTLQH